MTPPLPSDGSDPGHLDSIPNGGVDPANAETAIPPTALIDEDALDVEPAGVAATRAAADDAQSGGSTTDLTAPEGEDDGAAHDRVIEPFDPTLIRVRTATATVDLLLSRIQHGEMVLTPGFQRHEVWTDVARSRLIESALMRIPLPAVYVDATDEERWLVIDGLQRLSTFRRFITEESLALTGLEFLKQFTGKRFGDLPRPFQRRLKETQFDVYQLDVGTPSEVKFSIFKRINTGGLPLSAQEIRHALNQGPAADLLEDLASTEEFKIATDLALPARRMDDREAVLRALAFMIMPYQTYARRDFDAFLHDAMRRINEMDADGRARLSRDFARAMRAATQIFGRHAFRKLYGLRQRQFPVNKALFETWTVNLARCSDAELAHLIVHRQQVVSDFIQLMSSGEFERAVSVSTGDRRKILLRFRAIEDLIRGFVGTES